MKQKLSIAIIGGAGRSGQYIVKQLLSEGHTLRLLLRNPANFKIESPSIEVIHGDAADQNAIHSLLTGAHAVISTLGHRKGEPLVAYKAMENILHSMKAHNISRFISVVGLTLHHPSDRKRFETRLSSQLLKWIFPSVVKDKQRAFDLLQQSDLNWIVVRTPVIDFSDIQSKVAVSLEDCPGRKISAASLATFVCQQLHDNAFIRKAPFIANV
jgi:putative NADH-flavin reductase